MIKKLVAAGAAGAAALTLGVFTSPAHADVPCTHDTFHIHYAASTQCVQGRNVTYGMGSGLVVSIAAGDDSGWLTRRSGGAPVNFGKYEVINFGGSGVNFDSIHFN